MGDMNDQASFSLRGRNPDILTCIANLSNDEVFTPPEFANRMLDTIAEAWAAANDGADIWADSLVRFLDPCTKSGVFLREITSRLNKGLAAQIPDLQERVDHILTSWRGEACTARSTPMDRTPLQKALLATTETFGSRGWSTNGRRMANANIAARTEELSTAAKILKPTLMLLFTPMTSKLGWTSCSEAICSST
jgi:hypothetical protein